ncbi:CDP-alcohol phosphatidyltransferase family protein [Mucilaginibacter sp. 14171R-50]|uniref:CDP-alcohol phosphatidyltransferase family protein n=1 Tax=Mucilaginibacter sp. 14171R-50 TaxID=2703789 RepID=UPI001EE44FC1|nr:CDP-alcohol phosphatidyltransferase family protein [Mucilaginibacter sp. 14171R-50]
MKKMSYQLINLITFYRLAAAPVLVILLLCHQFNIFKWLLAISFFTDAIDGWLARRFKAVSLMGARIDSIADDLTVLVAVLGIALFHVDFLCAEWQLVAALILFYMPQNSIALIRFGKLTSFHTYLAKIAAVLQGMFLVLFYFLDEPLTYLFYITSIFTLLDLAEEIVLVLILPKWQADVKGLYWVLRQN